MNCNCPDDGILVEIPDDNCPIDLKQVQRLAFATRGKVIWDSAAGGGTNLAGVPQVDSRVDTKADWEARRVAVDNTKIVVTPRIGGDPIIEAGEKISEGGGDNTTFNGVEEVTGTNPSSFSCVFKSIASTTEKALKKLMCGDLEVYLFLEGGRIACKKAVTGETHTGFMLQAMFVGDKDNQGYATKDTNQMAFQLPSGWSGDLVIVTPLDFNPIYDI